MKVVLVVPRADGDSSLSIRGWPVPLGVLSIATYLKNKITDVSISILDNSILSDDEIIKSLDGDYIGFYATNRNYINSLKLGKIAKERGAIVIFGGPHASVVGKNILNNQYFVDYIIKYDGEASFYKLLIEIGRAHV